MFKIKSLAILAMLLMVSVAELTDKKVEENQAAQTTTINGNDIKGSSSLEKNTDSSSNKGEIQAPQNRLGSIFHMSNDERNTLEQHGSKFNPQDFFKKLFFFSFNNKQKIDMNNDMLNHVNPMDNDGWIYQNPIDNDGLIYQNPIDNDGLIYQNPIDNDGLIYKNPIDNGHSINTLKCYFNNGEQLFLTHCDAPSVNIDVYRSGTKTTTLECFNYIGGLPYSTACPVQRYEIVNGQPKNDMNDIEGYIYNPTDNGNSINTLKCYFNNGEQLVLTHCDAPSIDINVIRSGTKTTTLECFNYIGGFPYSTSCPVQSYDIVYGQPENRRFGNKQIFDRFMSGPSYYPRDEAFHYYPENNYQQETTEYTRKYPMYDNINNGQEDQGLRELNWLLRMSSARNSRQYY